MNRSLKTLAPFLFSGFQSIAQTVAIGTNSIPVEFLLDRQRSFDTNRVVAELSDFFSKSGDPETFFGSEMRNLSPGGTIQLVPGTYDGGFPEDEASDIVFSAFPWKRIEIGDTALSWILGQLEAATALSNSWTELESLFSELSDGSITNDPARCRETFFANGAVVTNSASDAEMFESMRTHWTRLTFCKPSIFAIRRGRISEDGPEATWVLCRYEKPGQRPYETPAYAFVFLDGRWRIVLQ